MGHADTGKHGAIPTTRRSKGEATKDAVRHNQRTFADEDPSFARYLPDEENPNIQTWFLLYYVDELAEEIRIELSLADQIVDGYVTSWHERLIVEPLAIGIETADDGHADQDEDEIDISVERLRG